MTGRQHTGPLAGTRAVALTHAWAGNFCASLLGQMGADVIQIEVRKRPDNWRGAYEAPIPANLRHVPTAVNPWNNSPLYNAVGVNKRCITLDLQESRGMTIFRELVPHADVIVENFSPRVLTNLGIGYDALCEIRPDIILASLSAYGNNGPWFNVPGIGGTIEPTSGQSSLTGYVDGPPLNSGTMYPDPVEGVHGVLAIVAALRHRAVTGEGQFIDVSMQEANLSFVGDAALEFAINGTERARIGNRHTTYAPHGIFPARGEEQWVAIACEDDEQWQSLCDVLDLSGIGVDERFTSSDDRKLNEDALESVIEGRTRQWERDDLVDTLSRAGLIAAPVLNSIEVREDQHLRARQLLRELDHPEAGPATQAVLPMHFSRTPATSFYPAPRQGEHTEEVLVELLGMDPADVEELVRLGISGEGPPQ